MFRYEEAFAGGWSDKTIEAMRKRRFERILAQMKPLGECRFDALTAGELARRLENSWQNIEKKPLRRLQFSSVKETVLGSINLQADCLSEDERDLVERALILGGSVRLDDVQELEAARALSLRLWGSLGLVREQPVLQLEHYVLRPAAQAMARREHEQMRKRFSAFHKELEGLLYCAGAVDDRLPQRMILRSVLHESAKQKEADLLARHYLWAQCDCMDYHGGVLLVHSAFAEPGCMLASGGRIGRLCAAERVRCLVAADILPEEIPLQEALEREIEGALRPGRSAQEVARELRYLCKQGAPLDALAQVLQNALIVLLSERMRAALERMHAMTPKWVTGTESRLH